MRRLLYFVADDWYFCSHRLALGRSARAAGYRVGVVTRVRSHAGPIKDAGLELFPVELARAGMNPLADLAAVRAVTRIYRDFRPDIVHHVAMKPVLYGTLAARRADVPCIVNALAGLGWMFSSRDAAARLLKPFVLAAFRRLLNRAGSRVVVQNPDDHRLMAKRAGVADGRIAVIRGSGVDLEAFPATAPPEGLPLVVLPARMLRDKGVEEFVAAARLLKGRGRFALVGDTDEENPAAVPVERLRAWHDEGAVEWWGFRSDMPRVLGESAIVCLPSWREGMPKALMEAAACARPIVTCDVPGCREVVAEGENGLLVPRGDVPALAAALKRLIDDPELRRRLGERGRMRAEAEFSVESVAAQTLALYEALLQERGQGVG